MFNVIRHKSSGPYNEHNVLKGFGHIIVDNPEFASIDQPLRALQTKYQRLINRFGGIVVVIICIIF
jgi:hypothetical protein